MAYLNPFYGKKKKDNIASLSLKAIIPDIKNVGVAKIPKIKVPKTPKLKIPKSSAYSKSKGDLAKALKKASPSTVVPSTESTSTEQQKIEGWNRPLAALGYLGDAFSINQALATTLKENRLVQQEQNPFWRTFWGVAQPATVLTKTGINLLGNLGNAVNVLATGNVGEDPVKTQGLDVELAKSINYVTDAETRAKVEQAVKSGQSVSDADAQYVSDYGISEYGGFGITSIIPATVKIASGQEDIKNIGDFFQVYARTQDEITNKAYEQGTFGNIPVISDVLGFSSKMLLGADNFLVKSFTKEPLGFVADVYVGGKVGSLAKNISGTGTVAKLTRGTLRSFDEVPGIPYITEFANLPSMSKYFTFTNAEKIINVNKSVNEAIKTTPQSSVIFGDTAENVFEKQSFKDNIISASKFDTDTLTRVSKVIDDFQEPLTPRNVTRLRAELTKTLSIDDAIVKQIVSTQPQYITKALKKVTNGRVSPTIEDLLKPNILNEVKSALMDGSLKISSSQYIADPTSEVLERAIKKEALTQQVASAVDGVAVRDNILGKATVLFSNFRERVFPQTFDANVKSLRERLVTELNDTSEKFRADPTQVGIKSTSPVSEKINSVIDFEEGKRINYERMISSEDFNLRFKVLQKAINSLPSSPALLRNLIEDIAKKIDFSITDDIAISDSAISAQRTRFVTDFFDSITVGGVLNKEKLWNNLMYISGIQLNDSGKILSVIDYINSNKELYPIADSIINLFNSNKNLFDYFKIQIGMNGADVSNFYGNYVPTIYNSPNAFNGDPTSPFLNFNASKASVKLSGDIQDLANLNLFNRGDILYSLRDIVSAHAMNISASNQMFFAGRLTGIGGSYFGITEVLEKAFGISTNGIDTNLPAVLDGASKTIETYINTAPLQVRELFVQELSTGVQSVIRNIADKSGKDINLSDVLKVSTDSTVSIDLSKIMEIGERGNTSVSMTEAKKIIANMQNTLSSDPAFLESVKDISKVDISEKMWELLSTKKSQDSISNGIKGRDSFNIPAGVISRSKDTVDAAPFNDIETSIYKVFPKGEKYFSIESTPVYGKLDNGLVVLSDTALKTEAGNMSNLINSSFLADFPTILEGNNYGLSRYTQFIEKYANKIDSTIAKSDLDNFEKVRALHQALISKEIGSGIKIELASILSDIFEFPVSTLDIESILARDTRWIIDNDGLADLFAFNPIKEFVDGTQLGSLTVTKFLENLSDYRYIDSKKLVAMSNLDTLLNGYYDSYAKNNPGIILNFIKNIESYSKEIAEFSVDTGLSKTDKYVSEYKAIRDWLSKNNIDKTVDNINADDVRLYFGTIASDTELRGLIDYLNINTGADLLKLNDKVYTTKLSFDIDNAGDISVSVKNIEVPQIIIDASNLFKDVPDKDIVTYSRKIDKINELNPSNIESLYQLAGIDKKMLKEAVDIESEIRKSASLKLKMSDVNIKIGDENILVTKVPHIDIPFIKGISDFLSTTKNKAKSFGEAIDNEIVNSSYKRIADNTANSIINDMLAIQTKLTELKFAKNLDDIKASGFGIVDGKIDFSSITDKLVKNLSPATRSYDKYSMKGVAEFNAKYKVTLSEVMTDNTDATSKDILSRYFEQSGTPTNTYYSDLADEIDSFKKNVVQKGDYKEEGLLTPKQISFVGNMIRAVEADKGASNMLSLYINSFLRLASGVKSVVSSLTLTTSLGFLATNFWGNGALVATFAGINRLVKPKYYKMGRDMFKFLQQSDKYFKNGIVDATTGEIRAFLADDFSELLKVHFKDNPQMLKTLTALSESNLGKDVIFNNMAALRDVGETVNMWNMLVLKDAPIHRKILGAIDGVASRSSKAGNTFYEKDIFKIMRMQGYLDKFAYLMIMDEYVAKYGDRAVFEFNRTFKPMSQISKVERKFASSLMMYYSFKRMNLESTVYALTNDPAFSRKIKAYLLFLEASQKQEDKDLMNSKQWSMYDTPFWMSTPNGVMTNMFLQNPFTESFDFLKSIDVISNVNSKNGIVQALNPLNPVIKYPLYWAFNNDPEMNRIFKWDDRYSLYTKSMKESTPKTLAFIKALPEEARKALGIEVLRDPNTNQEFALLNPYLNFAIQHNPILVADVLARGVVMLNDGKDDTSFSSYVTGKIMGFNEISRDSLEKSVVYREQNIDNELTKNEIERRESSAFTSTYKSAAQKQAQGLELSQKNKDVLTFYNTNRDKFSNFSEASKYYNEHYK